MNVKKNQRPPAPFPPAPVILSLETSTRVCGVALMSGDEPLLALSFIPTGGHSAFLMTAVDAVGRLTGVPSSAWSAVVVSRGPGSFTGLRIGMATAKGLALGLGIPLYGIPTLEVLARRAAQQLRQPSGEFTGKGGAAGFSQPLIAPVMDARKGQVFTALYRLTRAGLRELKPPVCLFPEELPRLIPPRALFTGDALGPYSDRIRAAYRGVLPACAPSDLWCPDAVTTGRMGLARAFAGEPSEVAELVPLYIRPADAEINHPHARRAPARSV